MLEEGGAERQITVSQDEGVRPATTLEGLAKLRPAFKPDGSTTAGESAVIIMSMRSVYKRLPQYSRTLYKNKTDAIKQQIKTTQSKKIDK